MSFRDGQTVALHGRVVSGPHDLLLTVPECEGAIVLVFAGEDRSGLPGDELQRDKNLDDFRRYTSAVYERTSENLCMQCSKYEVEATLAGKLSIAPETIPEGQWKDKLGLLHDESGKIVGKAGFGHPPIYKYSLSIRSVADVKVQKLPIPTIPKP
jgi:hypothetical protein